MIYIGSAASPAPPSPLAAAPPSLSEPPQAAVMTARLLSAKARRGVRPGFGLQFLLMGFLLIVVVVARGPPSELRNRLALLRVRVVSVKTVLNLTRVGRSEAGCRALLRHDDLDWSLDMVGVAERKVRSGLASSLQEDDGTFSSTFRFGPFFAIPVRVASEATPRPPHQAAPIVHGSDPPNGLLVVN